MAALRTFRDPDVKFYQGEVGSMSRPTLVNFAFSDGKPKLCGSLLAVLFTKGVFSPLEINQFSLRRLQQEVARLCGWS